MKTQPVVAADFTLDADGVPWSETYGDRYHPASGAAMQARHVFLAGSGLPGRWRGRDRFTILETGFGLGNNFLAAWDAWRADPARSARLDVVSIEKHPFERDALAQLHAASPWPALARQLVAAWPPLLPSLHALHFDDRRVRLMLAFGDIDDWLPEIVARFDAFFLDGFAPERNPAMWQPRVYKALARLASPGATAATWSAAHAVRDGLAAAGFDVRKAPGAHGKRDITLATYAPRFVPRRPPARIGLGRRGMRHDGPAGPIGPAGPTAIETGAATNAASTTNSFSTKNPSLPTNPTAVSSQSGCAGHRALIVGAGLAGSACAWALAEQGWTSRVVDRLPGIAQATSGNAAGLFHGVVHPHDGAHARFNRIAALHACDAVRHALARGAAGRQAGLLRVEGTRSLAEMEALLAALGIPGDGVEALSPAAASERSGLALDLPAWFHPEGGWVDPAGLARSYIERAGDATRFDGGVDVAALRETASGAGRWQLLAPDGSVIDEAAVVILANGVSAARLAGAAGAAWPLREIRGQTTLLPATTPGLRLPSIPVTGDGYVLPALPGGRALCGATSDADDDGLDVRTSDHVRNLERLMRLTGTPLSPAPEALRGRVGVRCVAADRLPIVGAVPLADSAATAGAVPAVGPGNGGFDAVAVIARRPDQPRFVARAAGLYVFTGLASRGITWSSLGAQVLASVISGAACPVEASLLDAIDAGRFAARAARRG